MKVCVIKPSIFQAEITKVLLTGLETDWDALFHS